MSESILTSVSLDRAPLSTSNNNYTGDSSFQGFLRYLGKLFDIRLSSVTKLSEKLIIYVHADQDSGPDKTTKKVREQKDVLSKYCVPHRRNALSVCIVRRLLTSMISKQRTNEYDNCFPFNYQPKLHILALDVENVEVCSSGERFVIGDSSGFDHHSLASSWNSKVLLWSSYMLVLVTGGRLCYIIRDGREYMWYV